MATRGRKKSAARRSRPARALPKRAAARAKAILPESQAMPIADRDPSHEDEDKDRYADLYHFAPVAYARLDRHGVVEEINQAGCRLFERTISEIVGRPMFVMVSKDSRSEFLEHIRRVQHTDGVLEVDLNLATRDGRAIPVRAYTKRLSAFGGRVMCWTMLMDLTERVRLEDARRSAEAQRRRAQQDEQLTRTSSEAKDRFLAMLSHELRTPLAPALLAVNRLLAETQDESVGRLGEIIRRNIEIEAHLINDLLDVTRIERGRLDVTLKPTNLHAVVVEAIEIVRAQAERKGIGIFTNLAATSRLVYADAGRLRQVFWNLLINAIKYSDSGSVEVLTADDDSGGVRITVKDAGVGMDQGTLARLFRPFERQQPKPGTTSHGLGLGLSICKGIIDSHGGRIWATSAGLGLGSTFEIDLPVIEEREAASTEVAPQPMSAAPTPIRVLLVEDDPDTADMLEMLLKTEGHEVGIAHSVLDALKQTGAGWDIVLSDLGLPDGSGLDVARRMRAEPRRPKLIALSGYGSPQDIARSRDAGFDEHLVKPLDFDLLKRVLRSA